MAQVYTITAPLRPGLTPPPGVIPSFGDPFTLSTYQTLTIAGCIITTTLVLIARMYTKWAIMKGLVWEDWTCCIGWAAYMSFMGLQLGIGNHGGGTHQWNLSYDKAQYNWLYANYGDMVYSIALAATKISIMQLILRIFLSVQRDALWWLTQCLIAVNTIFYTIYTFVPIFLCRPRRKIYNPDEPGHCFKIFDLYMASASFNMVSDIAMLSVPIYLIWNLQMSVRRKIGVSLIFGTGGLACLASTLRLWELYELTKTEDYTYRKMRSAMWAFAELACGLFCSCLPILPRLYQHISAIAPYTNQQASDQTALAGDPETRATVEKAAKTSLSKSKKGKAGGDWIHLDDKTLPSLPSRTTVDIEQRNYDDERFDSAVEGHEGMAKKDDLEMGPFKLR